MTAPSAHLLVLTTCPDEAAAERVARALVETGLAACVNALPGARSFYTWQGRMEDTPEWVLLIKTRSELFEPLAQALRAAHPYELPEVIAVPIATGTEDYLAWIDRAVSP